MEPHFNWITLFECLSLTHDNKILLAWTSKEVKLYWAMGKTQAKKISTAQFSSLIQLCPTLWDSMDCSMPGFLVHHQLRELAQMHVHRVSDAIHLLLCHPLLLLPSIFPNIRVFSNESVLHISWPKYWSFSISPSNEYSELISFRIDWFDLAVQGILKSLLQYHKWKASIIWCSAFFMVQLSHLYMITGSTIAWNIWTLVAKWCLWYLILCLGLSYLSFQGANVLSWLQSPSAVILEPKKINLSLLLLFPLLFHIKWWDYMPWS